MDDHGNPVEAGSSSGTTILNVVAALAIAIGCYHVEVIDMVRAAP